MKATLVIMAAGIGSRYGGGIKQIEKIGPLGEILMEYSIYDAIRSGFSKIVYIVKPEILEDVKELSGNRIARQKTPDGKPVEVEYVLQSYTSLPSFYKVPVDRIKPFGTVHAVLCARDAVKDPFVVINADDYYGTDAYETILGELRKMEPEGQATMVGYKLKNTISENGAVTRGICSQDNGKLKGVKETYKIRRFPDGTIRETGTKEDGISLDPESVVSMNIWGYTPWIFGVMELYMESFLKNISPHDITSECLLPVMVDEMISQKILTTSVLNTNSQWLGITYKEDKDFVAGELKKLHDRGVYPMMLY